MEPTKEMIEKIKEERGWALKVEKETLRDMYRLSLARAICAHAHYGQDDKAGMAYVDHPVRVADSVVNYGVSARIVALLHDVLEDTNVTVDTLRNLGFRDEETTAIVCLTKDIRFTYREYRAQVMKSRLATIVKIHDIKDNLLPWRLEMWRRVAKDPRTVSQYEGVKKEELRELTEHATRLGWLI